MMHGQKNIKQYQTSRKTHW